MSVSDSAIVRSVGTVGYMHSCDERVGAIARLLVQVLEDEKPSGRFKPDDPVVAADGTPLSRFPKDPGFFLGTRSESEHDALLRACSLTTPGPDGLTWRDFSLARGYSQVELARYEQWVSLCTEAGLWGPDLAEAAGFGRLIDAFETTDGLLAVAEVLEAATCHSAAYL